jgi:hypothetical protein
MKDQFQHIFLSSDPDNDELKALIHDCFFMPWLTGALLPDFAPELAGSYLIALEKPNGGIRDIAPVDICQRATVNDFVQVVQPVAVKVYVDTHPNFKQLALLKDGASHFLYVLNSAYYDTSFTSTPDVVIINLDISNVFGTLCARLVLDHLETTCVVSTLTLDYKGIDQSLWYFVSLLYTSGVAYLGNFQKLKSWHTPTMSTSSRNYRQTSSSFPC